jgi:transcriptional regulator with AAA-type ATPase domain
VSGKSDLGTREDVGAHAASSETCVVVRYGGERRTLEVRDYHEVVIGRSRQSTFAVDDDRVSRRHLRIVCREGALYASDLGSRNGTLLNGRRLQAEQLLSPGDELGAGPVRVTVCGRRRAEPVGSEGELHERLQAEVERATRFARPLALVGLRLHGAAAARHEALLRLASRLRRIDFLGEYAPGELLAILPETRLVDATALGESLAVAARSVEGVEASARAAAVPESSSHVEGLIACALEPLAPVSAPPEAVLIAEEPAVRALFETARRAAKSELTVLIVGETGVGKEVVAAELQRASARAAGPFVRLSCGSLPESLIESELFGHERGAFTGAERRRIGHIERAAGGTLLLDEIGELPATVQTKLLRVLEERRLTRVGSTAEVPVDVRFLATTNRDLEREVERGRFRQDLYFRLSPIVLRVPPLRERMAELPRLVEVFVRAAAASVGRAPPRPSDGFLAALGRYPWPGNLRELRNVVERAVVLAEGEAIGVEHLPDRFGAPAALAPMREAVDELERKSLEQALKETGGNRTHAARRLGISRRALLYKLKKYGID